MGIEWFWRSGSEGLVKAEPVAEGRRGIESAGLCKRDDGVMDCGSIRLPEIRTSGQLQMIAENLEAINFKLLLALSLLIPLSLG